MPELAGIVNRLWLPFDGVEIFGKCLPCPLDPSFHDCGRDVLSLLEVAGDEVARISSCRRERKSAISHHHGCDAVPTRAGTKRVPEHLRIHMRVPINEARGDDVSLGIDLAIALGVDPPHPPYSIADDSDVGSIGGQTGSIDDRAIADYEVVPHVFASLFQDV